MEFWRGDDILDLQELDERIKYLALPMLCANRSLSLSRTMTGATPATTSTPTDVNVAVNDAPVEDEPVTTTTSSVDILTTALLKKGLPHLPPSLTSFPPLSRALQQNLSPSRRNHELG